MVDEQDLYNLRDFLKKAYCKDKRFRNYFLLDTLRKRLEITDIAYDDAGNPERFFLQRRVPLSFYEMLEFSYHRLVPFIDIKKEIIMDSLDEEVCCEIIDKIKRSPFGGIIRIINEENN